VAMVVVVDSEGIGGGRRRAGLSFRRGEWNGRPDDGPRRLPANGRA
jgi:hypothetical protein